MLPNPDLVSISPEELTADVIDRYALGETVEELEESYRNYRVPAREGHRYKIRAGKIRAITQSAFDADPEPLADDLILIDLERLVVELVKHYDEGETMEKLVERYRDYRVMRDGRYYEINYRRVHQVLHRAASVTVRPAKQLLPPPPPGAVDAYKAGATFEQVAKTHGMSYGRMRRILLAAGVKPRSPGPRPWEVVRPRKEIDGLSGCTAKRGGEAPSP